MGGFVVYGVSRTDCRKKAEKATPAELNMPVSEWDVIVRALAEKLWNEAKVVRISPELDSPRFCEDWIAAGRDNVKLTKIMCRGEKIDKHGAITIKGGQPGMTWLPFSESMLPKFGPIE